MNELEFLSKAYVETRMMTASEALDLPETGKPILPEPVDGLGQGQHPSIDHERYHQLDARSNSEIVKAWSPRMLLAYWAGKFKFSSDALRLGTVVHELLLTPGRVTWNTDWPINERTGKGYGEDTKKVQDWMATVQDDGGFPIAGDKLDDAKLLCDIAKSHPRVADLFRVGGTPELTLLWSEVQAGHTLWFKAKPDLYVPGFGIVDFKTSSSPVDERSWPEVIWKYRYHAQAAHYLEGARQLGLDAPDFYHVVLQKTPPYEVMVARMGTDAISQGAEDRRVGLLNVTDVLINRNAGWLAPDIVETNLPLRILARYSDNEIGGYAGG